MEELIKLVRVTVSLLQSHDFFHLHLPLALHTRSTLSSQGQYLSLFTNVEEAKNRLNMYIKITNYAFFFGFSPTAQMFFVHYSLQVHTFPSSSAMLRYKIYTSLVCIPMPQEMNTLDQHHCIIQGKKTKLPKTIWGKRKGTSKEDALGICHLGIEEKGKKRLFHVLLKV